MRGDPTDVSVCVCVLTSTLVWQQITKTDKIKAMSKKQLRQIKKTQVGVGVDVNPILLLTTRPFHGCMSRMVLLSTTLLTSFVPQTHTCTCR